MRNPLDRPIAWLKGHQKIAIVLMLLCVGYAVVASYQASHDQSSRATDAANKVVKQERTDRQAAEAAQQAQLHSTAVVAHRALYRSCVRGKSVRSGLRANAISARNQARAFAKFLQTIIDRTKVTVNDPKASPAARAASKEAIPFYQDVVDGLDVNPVIPPPPPDCNDPRIVPTVAAFEKIAKDASQASKS